MRLKERVTDMISAAPFLREILGRHVAEAYAVGDRGDAPHRPHDQLVEKTFTTTERRGKYHDQQRHERAKFPLGIRAVALAKGTDTT